MHLQLHKVSVKLESSDPNINNEWRRLFEGWLGDTTESRTQAKLGLRLDLVAQLPPLPSQAPIFSDASMWSGGNGVLEVYAQPNNQALLHFFEAGLVTLSLDAHSQPQPPGAHGAILEQTLLNGRFEDVTFTSLAPQLRRQGYFLVHAFAASKNGRCVLISGPTQSGKTTTGLNLLLNGWELLANDVVLLEARSDGVYALPTPGDIGIRPNTFRLLPQLVDLIEPHQVPYQPVNISGHAFVNGRWSSPQPVTAMFFPEISAKGASHLQPQPAAICLVQLMQESIDRWDTPYLSQHVDILQKLCYQAPAYILQLGYQLELIPELISKSSLARIK